jgi:DNA-binding transcriptional LysR family regulator
VTITLRQLQYVIAVAEAESIGQAAKALYISQSCLSEAIKELEQELGFRVFDRSNLGVIATDDGAAFIRRAVQILRQFESLEKDFIREAE